MTLIHPFSPIRIRQKRRILNNPLSSRVENKCCDQTLLVIEIVPHHTLDSNIFSESMTVLVEFDKTHNLTECEKKRVKSYNKKSEK